MFPGYVGGWPRRVPGPGMRVPTMEVRPIHTEADYRATLKEISSLVDADPDPGTADGDRLDILTTLVQASKRGLFPSPAIKFRMEQMNLTRKDLEPLIGPRGRVAEVLNRRRPLSLSMIRSLHHKLHIPLESLIANSGALAANKRMQRTRQSVTKRKTRATSPRR